jgi:hypothetical protein
MAYVVLAACVRTEAQRWMLSTAAYVGCAL